MAITHRMAIPRRMDQYGHQHPRTVLLAGLLAATVLAGSAIFASLGARGRDGDVPLVGAPRFQADVPGGDETYWLHRVRAGANSR